MKWLTFAFSLWCSFTYFLCKWWDEARLHGTHEFLDVLLHRHLVCSFIASQRDSTAVLLWASGVDRNIRVISLQIWKMVFQHSHQNSTDFPLSSVCHVLFCKEYNNYIKLSGRYNYSICLHTLCEYYVVVLIKQKVVCYKANYIMPRL